MNRPTTAFRGKPPPIRFSSEILSIMSLFTSSPASSESTAKVIEGLIRTSLTALLARAKTLNARPTAQDYLFCLRDAPGMVLRLANHLSWKEVRRRAASTSNTTAAAAAAAAAAAGGVRAEESEDGIDEGDVFSIAAGGPLERLKQQQLKVYLPWDLTATLAEALLLLDQEMDPEAPQEDNAWTERLRQMDRLTEKMSREEYLAFAETRKTSFSFNKSKRFKDFVAYHAHLDMQPSDDIVDILSFLAYELVGYYTRIASQVRDSDLQRQPQGPQPPTQEQPARDPEEPLGPFSMPVERPLDQKQVNSASPILPGHVTRAVAAHGLGLDLGLGEVKRGGYGFANFDGRAKRRRRVV